MIAEACRWAQTLHDRGIALGSLKCESSILPASGFYAYYGLEVMGNRGAPEE
jgi:hypothetical protein